LATNVHQADGWDDIQLNVISSGKDRVLIDATFNLAVNNRMLMLPDEAVVRVYTQAP
jgi:hypothetical protein